MGACCPKPKKEKTESDDEVEKEALKFSEAIKGPATMSMSMRQLIVRASIMIELGGRHKLEEINEDNSFMEDMSLGEAELDIESIPTDSEEENLEPKPLNGPPIISSEVKAAQATESANPNKDTFTSAYQGAIMENGGVKNMENVKNVGNMENKERDSNNNNNNLVNVDQISIPVIIMNPTDYATPPPKSKWYAAGRQTLNKQTPKIERKITTSNKKPKNAKKPQEPSAEFSVEDGGPGQLLSVQPKEKKEIVEQTSYVEDANVDPLVTEFHLESAKIFSRKFSNEYEDDLVLSKKGISVLIDYFLDYEKGFENKLDLPEIKLYLKQGSPVNDKLPVVKTTYYFDGKYTFKNIMDVQYDPKTRLNWDGSMKEYIVNQQDHKCLAIYYMAMKAPFPFKDRDFCEKRVIFGWKGTLYVYYSKVDDMYFKKKSKYERAEDMFGGNRISYEGGKLKLEAVAQTDLKMTTVPTSMLKSFIPDSAKKFHKGVAKILKKKFG